MRSWLCQGVLSRELVCMKVPRFTILTPHTLVHPPSLLLTHPPSQTPQYPSVHSSVHPPAQPSLPWLFSQLLPPPLPELKTHSFSLSLQEQVVWLLVWVALLPV